MPFIAPTNRPSRQSTSTKHVLTILGGRPNFVKHAASTLELRRPDMQLPFVMDVVRTGQHYDEELSDRFFKNCPLDPPVHHLAIDRLSRLHLQLSRRSSTDTGPALPLRVVTRVL